MCLCHANPLSPDTPDHCRRTSQLFQGRRRIHRIPLALRPRECFSWIDNISPSVS